MSVAWTIKINGGAAQSLAALGISGVSITFRSLAEDTMRLTLGGTAADAAPVFAYGATVQLFRDGTQYFAGTCVTLHRASAATTEAHEYLIAGPWWQLARQPYMVEWQQYTGETPSVGAINLPDVLLNIDKNGAAVQTDAQIADAITWAAGCGVNVQNGTGYPQMSVFVEEVRDVMCADVITRQCRFTPDAVSWFDYSTTPPTFYLARGGDLATIALPVWDLENHESLQLTRRDDLAISEVCLYFKRTDVIDGVPCGRLWTDFYTTRDTTGANKPIGKGPRPLVGTVDLQGYNTSYAYATVTGLACDAQSGTEATRIAWWKVKEPLFSSDYLKQDTLHIASATVTDANGNAVNLATYPYEVLDTVPAWVKVGGSPAVTIEATIRASAEFQLYFDTSHSQLYQTAQRKEYAVRVKLTNCPPGSYSTVESVQAGEEAPSGMAQSLFNALSTAQYEGRVAYVETELTGITRPSFTLALSGGRAEWETMAALVQSVTEDLVSGRTEIEFGPMPKFSLDSLMELYRATRNRRQWTNPALRQTGSLPSAGVDLTGAAPRENTTAAPTAASVASAVAAATGGQATRVQSDAGNSRFRIEKIGTDGNPVSGHARVDVALADLTDGGDNQVKLRARASGFVLCTEAFNPSGLHYAGEWVADTAYSAGSIVTISAGTNIGTYITVEGAWIDDLPWAGDPWAQLPSFGNGYWV